MQCCSILLKTVKYVQCSIRVDHHSATNLPILCSQCAWPPAVDLVPRLAVSTSPRCSASLKYSTLFMRKYHLKCTIVLQFPVNGIENTCNCGSNPYPTWSKARYFLNYIVASPGESSVPTASGWRGGERHNDCLKSYNSHLFPLPPSLSYFPHSCLLPLVSRTIKIAIALLGTWVCSASEVSEWSLSVLWVALIML